MRRQKAKAALALLLMAIITLAIAEVIVRIFSLAPPPKCYEGKKYAWVKGGRIECMNPLVSRGYFQQKDNAFPGCVFYSVNNLGFRNPYPVSEKKIQKSYRIVAIGDSFTYGFGVQEQDVFLTKLETYWNSQNKNVQIINAARPAYGLQDYQKTFTKIIPLNPDMVWIGINLNDIATFPASFIIDDIQKKFDWPLLREHSALLNFGLYNIERSLSSKKNIQSILDSYTPQRKLALRNFVHETKALATKNHIQLFFFVYPIFYDFHSYAFAQIHADIEALLKQENVNYVDFLASFKNREAAKYWITKNDQHPNEIAHSIFFETVKSRFFNTSN